MIIVPIYDTLLLPDVTFYFKKDVIDSWNIGELSTGKEIAFAMLKDDYSMTDLTADSFFPIGVAAKVENIDNEGNIRVRTTDRVELSDISVKKGKIKAELSFRFEVEDILEDEKQEISETIKNDYLRFVQNFQWGLWARGFILQWKNMHELACAMAGYFSVTWEEKYAIIETDSLRERYLLIEKMAYEFIEMAKVQSGAEETQKEEHERLYRENALKKQIDILQKELDEMHTENVSDLIKPE